VNLREQAEADNEFLLEDDVNGFAASIKFTEPNDSVAIAAVLRLNVIGVSTTIIPINTRWKSGDYYYRQNAAVTITAGVATAIVTAKIAGADSNLANGTVIDLVTPIVGVTSATVLDTTTQGVNRNPDIVYNVKGQYNRIGVDIDPETGMLVAGNKSAVTVRLSRFTNGRYPENGWSIEATDITGTLVKGKVLHPMLDRTSGRVTLLFKR